MSRILITGNAGSGKSSLSHRLGKSLKLPVYSLDKVVWQPGWKKTEQNVKKSEIEKIISQSDWIVDGVSTQVLEKADLVIFLDIPLYRCFYNIVHRFLKNGLGVREGLPENCPEYVGVFKALKIAFFFQKNVRPKLIDASYDKRFIRLRNYIELQNVYESLKHA